jgi:rhodanese-related sulfurtransferase
MPMVVRKLMILLGCVAAFLINGCGNRELIPTVMEENAILLDVRTAEEYNAGHIPGSINIDVKSGKFGASADSLLNRENTVAIYCRSGRRSKEAAKTLNLMGFDVIELDKGYNSWVEAHLNR